MPVFVVALILLSVSFDANKSFKVGLAAKFASLACSFLGAIELGSSKLIGVSAAL